MTDTTLPDEKPGTASPETAPAPVRRRTIGWTALIAAVTVLTVVTGLMGWQLWRHHQHEAARAHVLEVARAYAVTLTTTDQNALDQNFEDVLNGATGKFKDAYGKAAAQMRKMLIDNKVNTSGTVLDAAVKTLSGDEAQVLLAVEQSVTNAKNAEPRSDHLSISMTMRKVDDRWLAAEVRLPGAENLHGN